MYLLQENFDKCLSVSLRQFVLLVGVWWIPQAVREIQISQHRGAGFLQLLPWTLVPGWGQRSEVWSRYCWAGELQLIYPCCTLARWAMNQGRQSHTVIPDHGAHHRPFLPPSTLLPLSNPPPPPRPLEERGRGFAFGVFSDVSHVARQSIRKSVTRGQLWISEHGETQHLEWACQTVTRNCSGRLFD